MVLNAVVLLHCEGGSRGSLRLGLGLENDCVYGVYEDGHLVFEGGRVCY